MKIVYHQASSRGHANYGWLDTSHTFSFADYYDSERMGFGVLRVLNDDSIAPGMGFGTHPHNNMEIITIPLQGALRHKDTLGNEAVIRTHEVQTMSAGTGISHSEFNDSNTDPVHLLQIWIQTKERDIAPEYSQKLFDPKKRFNQLECIVSGNRDENTVYIHQDAFISWGEFEADSSVLYKIKNPEKNGVYVFVVKGNAQIEEYVLSDGDGMGIEEAVMIEGIFSEATFLILLEIPMK